MITLGAAVLRLLYIGRVSPDPFYDAAVRSMSLSAHNFFFGAFEPGGSVSIDKPPVDLWLQVVSVKLLGFSSTTLKLPEVLGGVISVPLLYAAVKRMWGVPAGLAAAVGLAVLPVEVITARSDTMDAVMMATIVLALLLLVRAGETGRSAWLLGAAAALGVAFNVKLLESLVAVPGLVVFAYLGLPGPRRRRLLQMLAAGLVYVVVALSWLTATLLVPAKDRPWAIGSTNGSAWNAAFVFNGTDRLSGKTTEPLTLYRPGYHYPVATQSERDHIPIVPPSPWRLLARVGPLSGQRLGMEILLGLLLGIPAMVWELRRQRRRRMAGGPQREPPRTPPPAPARREPAGAPGAGVATAPEPALAGGAEPHTSANAAGVRARVRRASIAGLAVWMVTGIALFSDMARLHPRYVEGFTPAVAALFGIGAAWAASPRGRTRLAFLTGSMVIVVIYAELLEYGTTVAWWVGLLGALGAIGCALLARAAGAPARLRELAAPWGVLALMMVAVLAIPMSADISSIDNGVTDAGYVGALPTGEQNLLSSYLRAHQGHARYELAAESATGIGSLVVQDARPIVVLTTYEGRVFTTVAELEALIARGEVRYAFLNSFCGSATPGPNSTNAACSAPAIWIREHGTDVSRQAGLKHKTLYLLPGAHP